MKTHFQAQTMHIRNIALLMLTTSILLVGSAVSQDQPSACQNGWFGSLCQYKCHCESGACSTEGECTNKVTCAKGWFGPACQYVDLATGRGGVTSNQLTSVTDGDDTTCVRSLSNDNVTISLVDYFHFTWLRVRVSNSVVSGNLTVNFGPNARWSCTNERTSKVDPITTDIHCDLNQTINSVTLSGPSVLHLCSVYISGGRNVALKQNITQTDTYSDSWGSYPAEKAVDGNTSRNFYKDFTCTHTKTYNNPSLNLTLSTLQHVTRYVLYNRDGRNADRLQNFLLRSYNQTLNEVFSYRDPRSTILPVYTVTPDNVTSPIYLVKVTVSNNYLTLCELEIYGDSACEPGRYGRECEHTCNCAGGEPCFVSTGGCPSGCAVGFQGENCSKACDRGKYGLDCQFNCSQFCVGENDTSISFCDNVYGTCRNGCQSGYQGTMCTEEVVAAQHEGDNNTNAVVIAVVVVVVAAVILLLVVVFLLRRKRAMSNGKSAGQFKSELRAIANPNTSTSKDGLHVMPDKKAQKPETRKVDNNDVNSGIYFNETQGKTTVISLEELPRFMKTTDRAFFESQFTSIPSNQFATVTVGQSPENRDKNRYKNICAYDHSRVHLIPNESKRQGDYINASYVKGYMSDEKFIASQGPTKTILEDFIRMLWEQEVDKVVMLTNLVEDGKQKCERYWPEDGDMKVGEITVGLLTSQVFADYTIRRLQLTKDGESVKRFVHFHFTSWPDKDVPTMPWGLVDFEQRVASYPSNKPIVVHCSAGVGRTGTFIALRNVMREAEETGHMDFFTTVQNLRHDRLNMIQTLDQYIFLHHAAQVAMLCIGTNISFTDAETRIQSLEAKSKCGVTQLQREFQAICNVCETTVDESVPDDKQANVYENSRTLANNQMDRYPNIIAKEAFRAVLSGDNKNSSDYINAVLVPSFTKQNHEILTQLPLPTTIIDFWRLVTEYSVALIVAFETDITKQDHTVGHYLPASHDGHLGEFQLARESVSTTKQWTQDTVHLTWNGDTNRQAKKQWSVTHVTCTTNLDPSSLLALTQHVRSLKPAGDGRTLYTCRNGAEYSGLVCVMSLLLDRMDNDHHLTVPLVVGAIKAIRSQVIPSLEQYRLLYRTLQFYSQSMSIYSNFKQ